MSAKTAGATLPARRGGEVPVDGKARVPRLRPGLVERPDVLRSLSDHPVVLVVAPPGYGKTTSVVQWTASREHPVAWVTCGESENDPVALVALVARALDAAEALDPDDLATLTLSGADAGRVLLPLLGRVLAAFPMRSWNLVLDDVHALYAPKATAVLETLIEQRPDGCQIVLAGRSDPEIALPRLLANGSLARVEVAQLRMTEHEGTALVRAAGVPVDDATGSLLVDKTEGWPGALYLTALALRASDDPARTAVTFAGDDRLLVDYVRTELLSALPEASAEFMVRSSPFERLSGDLCDAVLERSGSAALLEELADSNLCVEPLDRRREWYRYHGLLRDMLRWELHRRSPEVEQAIHGRASAWFEARREIDEAIAHAHAAGDAAGVARLIWRVAPGYLGVGRTATVGRWLEQFNPDEVARDPALSVTAAWWALTAGDTEAVDRWATATELLPADTKLPDGTPLSAARALLRALVGSQGLTRMRDDAMAAYALDRPDGAFRVVACVLEGAALRLLDEPERARGRLEEGASVGSLLLPAAAADSDAQLAALAIDLGDWAEAQRMIERALRTVHTHVLRERPVKAAVFSIAALVHARQHATDLAADEAKHALGLVAQLVGVGPWLAIEARIFLARAWLLLGDLAQARKLVAEAERLVERTPDLGVLPAGVGEVRALVGAAAGQAIGALPALTPAEVRVLQHLPTHETFAEIANELFVSRNTVKTQAIALYRKLGVSSRGAAVEQARAIGLLEP